MIGVAFLAAQLATSKVPPLEWREADSNGQSCASCHSPSGFELRGMPAADLLRRGQRHLSVQQSAILAEFFASDPTPFKSVPLQPGNEVLPGDQQFLKELTARFPWILHSKVDSISAANAFRDKLRKIDLFQLKVAIPLSPTSSDGFHGQQNATIADWIPDVSVPSSSSSSLAHPSDYVKLDKSVSASQPNSPIQMLAKHKYRALLGLEYFLRHKSGERGFEAPWVPKDNPFWAIGDFGQIYADADFQSLGMTSKLIAENSGGPSPRQQMAALRTSWFWLGWMFDPALMNSGQFKSTIRGDYFVQSLLEDMNLPSHALFMLTRKLAEQPHSKLPFEFQYTFMLTSNPIQQYEPKDNETKSIFRKLASQSFRMSLWLLLDDLQRNKKTIRKVPQLDQIARAEAYMKSIGEADPTLFRRVRNAMKNAAGV